MNIDTLAGLENMVILDRMNKLDKEDPLLPFALDEWLCARTGKADPRSAICGDSRNRSSWGFGTAGCRGRRKRPGGSNRKAIG